MRITTRLRIISGLTLAALVVQLPILGWSFIEFNSARNDSVIAGEIKEAFFKNDSLRNQYLLYREDHIRAQWEAVKESTDSLLLQATDQFQGEQNQQLLQRLQQNTKDRAELFQRIVSHTEPLETAVGNRQVYEELNKRLVSQLMLKAVAFRDMSTTLQEASDRRVEQTYQNLAIIIGVFALLLALTTIQSAWQISRLIGKGLAPLHAGAKIIAGGNLGYRIKGVGADEFAELAQSFNDMTGKLQAFTSQIEAELIARTLSEETLGELNRNFVAFLENASDFIYFKDENSRFRFCSQTLADITGHASWRDMVGKDDLEVFPKETAQIYHEEELPIFRDGKPLLNKTDPYFDTAGNKGWVSTNKWPLLDQEGKVIGLFGISRDITERKKMEEAALAAALYARSLIEVSLDPLVTISAAGKITDVNTATEKVTGESRETLIGSDFADYFTNPEKAREGYQQVFSQGFVTDYPLAIRHVSGTVTDVLYNASVYRDDNGQVLGVFAAARDITERKKAEESIQAASVFTHAREGIMITDADGTIINVNEAFTHITSYTRDEVLGRNPRLLSSGRQGKEYYAAMWHDLLEKGHWYGEIWNRRKSGEVYAVMENISAVRDEQGKIQHFVALFLDITAIKAHESQLEHLAHYDALTALPNRVLLADRLRQGMVQSQRHHQMMAVAYLDLDGFKAINDSHGHEVGDQLLMTVASRMKQALREGDTLARLGGDEFVAVFLDLNNVAASVTLLDRLLAAAAQPVLLGNLVLQVSASIGVTFYPQAENLEADQLLRQADQAMYQAKQAGRKRYHIFDAELDRSVRGHHESQERIRRALSAREFVLHYQPKVNVRSGAVIGAEALIRWQHPENGLLAPAEFLPVIEDHPLAVDIGEWVIATALSQMAIWQAAGLNIPVSVNVGARQLQQADFVERLRALLAAHPEVSPGDLALEVLETSALQDLARVSQVIESCREIGVMFALDDFGTGYSSLTYLKRLAVTELKIDQSFVCGMLDDPDDLAILEGVLSLATAFRRQVIAEGVETVEQGEMLLQLGCDLAQGYGIARPMPADELPAWAAAWHPDPLWADLPAISHDDLPLLFAGAEHRAWIAMLSSHLRGKREALPLDHQLCRFGKWLETEGVARYGQQPAFQSIEPLHRQVHALAAKLLELHAVRPNAEALLRLPELHALSDSLLEKLKALVQEKQPQA
ncbi:EAL domain-containing protein [Propionivibrio sp.]|uniref:EAL domain-containing protein n=1 Tax=Propionivibrio sp. TaxID=2212460 RepID=UPI003BF11651